MQQNSGRSEIKVGETIYCMPLDFSISSSTVGTEEEDNFEFIASRINNALLPILSEDTSALSSFGAEKSLQ